MDNGLEYKEKKVLSTDEVKNLLNADTDEIKNLCRQVNVYPKKDANSGRAFFMKQDVDILKRIKELHERGQRIANPDMRRPQLPSQTNLKPQNNETKKEISPELNFFLGKIAANQDNIVNQFSTMLDDKINGINTHITELIENKLDGIDEVIVELIKCKTENENLRFKINELIKENHNLKKENDSYKSVGLGFYVKNSIK